MRGLQFQLLVAFLLAFVASFSTGYRFFGGRDLFQPREARGPMREPILPLGAGSDVLPEAMNEESMYKLIMHLNDVGKRRRR